MGFLNLKRCSNSTKKQDISLIASVITARVRNNDNLLQVNVLKGKNVMNHIQVNIFCFTARKPVDEKKCIF